MNPVLKWLLYEVKAIIYNFLLSPSLATYSCSLHKSLLIYLFWTKEKANMENIPMNRENIFELIEYRRMDELDIKNILANYIISLIKKKHLRFKGNARKIIASMLLYHPCHRERQWKQIQLCDQCLLYVSGWWEGICGVRRATG